MNDQHAALRKAAQEFIDKVDSGEARSVRSYAAFKEALVTAWAGDPESAGPAFDYVAETELTASNSFTPEQVGIEELREKLRQVIEVSQEMDKIKKALFRKCTREEAGLGEFDLWTFDDDLSCLPAVAIDQNIHADLFHGIIGNITEVGEQAEILLKFLNGERADITNGKEEIGDNLWYLARLVKYCDSTFEAEMKRNIAKLRARHGSAGFNKERDINRDLDEERKTLEGPNGKSL